MERAATSAPLCWHRPQHTTWTSGIEPVSLRGLDSNQRPPGYEPSELPSAPPHIANIALLTSKARGPPEGGPQLTRGANEAERVTEPQPSQGGTGERASIVRIRLLRCLGFDCCGKVLAEPRFVQLPALGSAGKAPHHLLHRQPCGGGEVAVVAGVAEGIKERPAA